MSRLRLGILASVLGLVIGGFVFAQDKKDPKDPPPKARGQLPPNWGKLGLTDEQKQKIYTAQAKYKEQIDKLQAQIANLKGDEKKELEAVLTADQKKRLVEILTKGIGDPEKK